MQVRSINLKGHALALLMAGALSAGLAFAPAPAYAVEDDATDVTVEEAANTDDNEEVPVDEQGSDAQPEITGGVEATDPVVTPTTPEESEPTTAVDVDPAPAASDDDQDVVADDPEAPVTDEAPEAVEPAPADETDTPAADETIAASSDNETEEEVPEAPGVKVNTGTAVIQTSVTNNQVVEATGATPKADALVKTKTYNKAKNQKWIVKQYKNTLWYYLYSAANNKLALGVSGKAKAGASVKVVNASSTSLLNLLWSFVKGAGGTYKLASAADPSLFLTVKGAGTKDGTALALAAAKTDASGKKSQQFYHNVVAPKIDNRVTGLEGAYVIKDKSSGLATSVAKKNSKAGASVVLNTGAGDFQKAYLEPVTDGYYKVWIVGSAKVLAVKDSSILNGANVIQTSNGNSANRYWALVDNGDGTYSLINKASGHKLTAAGSSKGANLYSGVKGSSFKLANTSLLSSGIVEIKPRTKDDVSANVKGASVKDGATINLWTDNNKLNQRFQLVSEGKGLWRVRTASSGGYLSVKGGKLVQYGKGDTKANSSNVWRETFRGGWYGLMLNDGSNLALALTKGKTKKGTTLTVVKANGKDAQHFTFEKANLIDGGVFYISCKREVSNGVPGNLTIVKGNALLKKKADKESFRFIFQKVGGAKNSVYKLINLKSGLALTSGGTKSGSFYNVGQKKYSGSKYQLWQAQIADGGYVEFVDDSGKGANLFGRTKDDKFNVATRKLDNNSKKNNGRSFKLEVASGWMKVGGVWHYYNDNGEKTTLNGYAHSLSSKVAEWTKSKSSFFKKKYFITTSITKTRTIIWEKKRGEWVPKYDWLCTTSSPAIGSGVTGWFRLGAGSGGEVAQYVHGGRCKNLYAWSVKYAMFLVQDLAIHSTIYGSSPEKQVGHRLSHGCIRLVPKNAKWVWDNCKNGTGVHLFM